jgi:hypothetical protein
VLHLRILTYIELIVTQNFKKMPAVLSVCDVPVVACNVEDMKKYPVTELHHGRYLAALYTIALVLRTWSNMEVLL